MNVRLFFDRNKWGIWSFALRGGETPVTPLAYGSGFGSSVDAVSGFRRLCKALTVESTVESALLADAVYNVNA